MHLQRQGLSPLRIRSEGFHRHHQPPCPGRHVRAACQGTAGQPHGVHTLRGVIEDTERFTGCAIERANVDKGYGGHGTENPRRVFISSQKRAVLGIIRRELRRRSIIERIMAT